MDKERQKVKSHQILNETPINIERNFLVAFFAVYVCAVLVCFTSFLLGVLKRMLIYFYFVWHYALTRSDPIVGRKWFWKFHNFFWGGGGICPLLISSEKDYFWHDFFRLFTNIPLKLPSVLWIPLRKGVWFGHSDLHSHYVYLQGSAWSWHNLLVFL